MVFLILKVHDFGNLFAIKETIFAHGRETLDSPCDVVLVAMVTNRGLLIIGFLDFFYLRN